MFDSADIEAKDRAEILKLGIVGFATAIIFVMWVTAGISIYNSQDDALADMNSNASNLTLAFDDELTHSLDTIAGTMDAVANRMRAKGSDMDINTWAREFPIVTGPVIEGTIIAPNGMVVSGTSAPNMRPIDLSDREHFRIQRDSRIIGLYIGKPVQARTYFGQLVIPISKRVESTDGRFLGVLVFLVSPAKLTSLSQSINLGNEGMISLVGMDSIIRARFSIKSPEGLEGVAGSIARGASLGFNPGIRQGSYVVQGTVDHVTRLFSYRRVTNYPLFVIVGLGYDEGLVSWWRNTKSILILTIAASVLIFGFALYLIREIGIRAMRDLELADERRSLQAANTELIASETRAVHAETLLADAINCISEAFVIYDKDDRLVLCNDTYRQLYPLSTQYMLPGIKFEELLRHGLALGEYKDAIGREEQWLAERLLRHQQASGLVEQNRSDGRHIMVIDRRMKSGGIAGLRIDVTNLVETREALQKALVKAEAVNQAKTLFLANMSHELRTPLNAVIGFSQIIRDQTLGPAGVPAYAEYAKDIYDSGEHLLEIINNVLDAARVEVNKFDLKEETVEIGELVQSALQMVRVQAGKKSIALEQRLPEEPIGLRAEGLRLRQILINLLANAVKFTPEGGHVILSFDVSPAAAVFSVADTGIGMSPDEIAVATEPFRQIENAMIKRHEGVGLGLSLAKHMTEMHGGRLEIESERGVGTTVRIVLPPERILHAPRASAAA